MASSWSHPKRAHAMVDRSATNNLIQRLQNFNAKERYWLIHQALGGFTPKREFINSVALAAGVDAPSDTIEVTDIYLAMDYHLNWLFAALTELKPPPLKPPGQFTPLINKRIGPDASGEQIAEALPKGVRALLENSQEDIDLLIAYPRVYGGTQILLVEAKCIGNFTTPQIESKVTRLVGLLTALKELGCLESAEIDVKLILMSPNAPSKGFTESMRGMTFSNLVCAPSPAAKSILPWIKMNISIPETKDFWFVKFGGRIESGDVRDKRSSAGKAGSRWYWPEPSLLARSIYSKK